MRAPSRNCRHICARPDGIQEKFLAMITKTGTEKRCAEKIVEGCPAAERRALS